jgi:hypothetical protein
VTVKKGKVGKDPVWDVGVGRASCSAASQSRLDLRREPAAFR